MDLFARGVVEPLPRRVFPVARIHDAFRHMALARHIGKVVVSQVSPKSAGVIRNDATYLITGGLGALGLHVAGWMVARGARSLVLIAARRHPRKFVPAWSNLSRRAPPSRSRKRMLAHVPSWLRCLERVAQSGPPIRGIVHAAGVLHDGILLHQDWESFRRVMVPKIQGSWNLHHLTRNLDLDFFVLFSSGASLLGPPGQGNYAAANAFLDGLAHWRRAHGLPALSINWGPWSGAGMAAKDGDADRWDAKGMATITPESGLHILERLIQTKLPQVAVLPMNWTYLSSRFAAASSPPLFAHLLTEDRAAQRTHADIPDIASVLKGIPPGDRQALLIAHVQDQVRKVLGLDASRPIDPRQSLFDMGMDSLMAVEVRNRLQTSLAAYLPSTLIFDYPSIDVLAGYLVTQCAGVESAEANGHNEAKADPERARRLDELKSLSEEKLEELLMSKLDALSSGSHD